MLNIILYIHGPFYFIFVNCMLMAFAQCSIGILEFFLQVLKSSLNINHKLFF